MDISGLAKLPIIDGHTHFGGEDLNAIDGMLEQEAASGDCEGRGPPVDLLAGAAGGPTGGDGV